MKRKWNRVITLTYVDFGPSGYPTPIRASWLNYAGGGGQYDVRYFSDVEWAKSYCLQRFGACRFIDKTGLAG